MTDVVSLFPAPDGYVVDFDNPQRTGEKGAYWAFGVGVFLSLLFTAQRVHVKWVLRTPWTVDDTLLTIAWLASMASQIFVVYGFSARLQGVHAWEMSIDNFNIYLLLVWLAAIIYLFAGSCTKLAILVFYLRVSPQRWLRWGVYVSIFIIAGYTIALILALIFSCDPVEKTFNVMMVEGHCSHSGTLYIATAACNIASDVMLFMLPIPMVCGLQMPLKQKMALSVIFGIGSATIVTSILRALLLPHLLASVDPTWDVTTPALLIVIESNLIVICGMAPTLLKFLRHVAPKLIGEGTKGSGNNINSRASRLVPPPSPGLVTFGSLPSNRKRSSAKFGGVGGDGNCDVYPLRAMRDSDDDRNLDERRSFSQDGGRDDLAMGVVNTKVVGGARSDSDWDVEGGRCWNDSRSGDSKYPIVTTRIEVTYDDNTQVKRTNSAMSRGHFDWEQCH